MRLPERERGARFCSSAGRIWLRRMDHWPLRSSPPRHAFAGWGAKRAGNRRRFLENHARSVLRYAAALVVGESGGTPASGISRLPSDSRGCRRQCPRSARRRQPPTTSRFVPMHGMQASTGPGEPWDGRQFARDQDAIDRAGCVSNNVNASVARSVTRTSSQRLSSRAKPGDPGSRRPAGSHSTVPEPSSRPSSAVPTTAPATTPGSRPSITTASVKREDGTRVRARPGEIPTSPRPPRIPAVSRICVRCQPDCATPPLQRASAALCAPGAVKSTAIDGLVHRSVEDVTTRRSGPVRCRSYSFRANPLRNGQLPLLQGRQSGPAACGQSRPPGFIAAVRSMWSWHGGNGGFVAAWPWSTRTCLGLPGLGSVERKGSAASGCWCKRVSRFPSRPWRREGNPRDNELLSGVDGPDRHGGQATSPQSRPRRFRVKKFASADVVLSGSSSGRKCPHGKARPSTISA